MKYSVANFKITCTEELMQIAQDLLADAAGEAGFESFEEITDGLKGYIQQNMYDYKALDTKLKTFPIPNVQISYTIQEIEDRNWNERWESTGFTPIDIANKVTIYDAAHYSSDVAHTDIAIGIDVRQAFGTGTHQTTRLVISALLDNNISGKRVLDCGCGSGILSIAASKLGADEIWAYDIDEWCIKNTQHNTVLNSIDNINIQAGDVRILTNINKSFGIIMANINRNILLNDMSAFVQVMEKDGILILSGFYETDAVVILKRASELGLIETRRHKEDEWICLTLRLSRI
uniref:50S ribosomal protein L11 methyltransferase n=1 Tax=Hoylesella pleuritidis TaxID=407975 RepID=UPI0004684F91|nr:50S ribosomal protein L11 methyltransferase [Hoylesella pleuritidis]